jgi:hypothetical protein
MWPRKGARPGVHNFDGVFRVGFVAGDMQSGAWYDRLAVALFIFAAQIGIGTGAIPGLQGWGW